MCRCNLILIIFSFHLLSETFACTFFIVFHHWILFNICFWKYMYVKYMEIDNRVNGICHSHFIFLFLPFFNIHIMCVSMYARSYRAFHCDNPDVLKCKSTNLIIYSLASVWKFCMSRQILIYIFSLEYLWLYASFEF